MDKVKLRYSILHGLLGLLFTSVTLADNLAEPPTVDASQMPVVINQLKQGGYVLYFRHLDTRQDQEDQHPLDMNDCQTQRNLSDEGRERGREIGLTIQKASIPIGQILSSPLCRTQETANLLFGRTQVEPDLFFAIELTEAEKKVKGAALLNLLTRVPELGHNNVIIGHTANLQEAVGLWPKPEGVAYLFRPDGHGGLEAIARIPPEAWLKSLQ